jgi:hypothetical protein
VPVPRLLNLRLLKLLALVVFVAAFAAQAGAREPRLSKYPLRVHVLASDETHKTPRMSPAESLTCDAIDGMTDSISPNPGGPVTLSGVSSDPCLYHADIVAGRFMDLPDEDPVYSGEGRGDLVSPPSGTQGITFQYDNCVRVRVLPGFQSLPARWKKPGRILEVLIPSDDIPVGGRPLPPVKCEFTVTMHDYIYLRLRNGKVVQVSQEVYQAKPALRDFLSGGTETVERRLGQFTVPAHPPQ